MPRLQLAEECLSEVDGAIRHHRRDHAHHSQPLRRLQPARLLQQQTGEPHHHRKGERRRGDHHGSGHVRRPVSPTGARRQDAQRHHHARRRPGRRAPHRRAPRRVWSDRRRSERLPGDGRLPGHGHGDHALAQQHRDRFRSRDGVLHDGQPRTERTGRRLPGPDGEPVLLPARRVHVRVPAPGERDLDGHRFHRGHRGRDSRRERRPYRQPQRRNRHRRPVFRRAEQYRPHGADGRWAPLVPAQGAAWLEPRRRERLRPVARRSSGGLERTGGGDRRKPRLAGRVPEGRVHLRLHCHRAERRRDAREADRALRLREHERRPGQDRQAARPLAARRGG